ncbi:uncharacterized protein ARMOST_18470 [Armillaria ostoyae]|uniref:Uncharacterized protein n=1 Tax=Armillaria ostoyae TaxID=47428 RepID=A0A284S1U5_ARMOS|nr:uncharacterized protein ARMOST_18470 [Armillaria ostoyae]
MVYLSPGWDDYVPARTISLVGKTSFGHLFEMTSASRRGDYSVVASTWYDLAKQIFKRDAEGRLASKQDRFLLLHWLQAIHGYKKLDERTPPVRSFG